MVGKSAEAKVDLMYAPALGAAIEASVLDGQRKDFLILRTTRLSLSVD